MEETREDLGEEPVDPNFKFDMTISKEELRIIEDLQMIGTEQIARPKFNECLRIHLTSTSSSPS